MHSFNSLSMAVKNEDSRGDGGRREQISWY
jgi:hypothetical protein